MKQGFARRSAALVGSFAIYLLPLVGPHGFWLLGEHLYRELTSETAHRSASWIAVDVGVALAAQAALGLLLLWMLARRGVLRVLVLAASVPLFFLTLESAYLLVIPSYFLIEPDVAPEQSQWTEECFLPGLNLAAVRTPPDLPLERAGLAWVSDLERKSYSLLESCERPRRLDLDAPGVLFTAPFALANGKALFAVWDNAGAKNDWWYFAGGASPPARLDRPPRDPSRSTPILSNDGDWTAWKEYVPGETTTPLPEQIVIRSLVDASERVVPLPPPGRASVELLGVDTEAEQLTLFEHDYADRGSRVVLRGFDGSPRGRQLAAEGADPQPTTFLQVGDGWVAWDAYREEGRYRIAWSLPAGSGSGEVPRGRGITAAAVDPSGSYVAVSTTTALNIGALRDSVYVLRARDGAEVFRRYLATYSRSRVAFLGTSRFAYDDQAENRGFGLRILSIPRSP